MSDSVSKEPLALLQQHTTPRQEISFNVIATINPTFDVNVLGVVAISSTKAWIYSYTQIQLIDIEKGELIKCFSPDITIKSLQALDENHVIIGGIKNKVILKISIISDLLFEVAPFIKKPEAMYKCKYDLIEDETQKVQTFALSQSRSYLLVCTIASEWCACFQRKVNYIYRYHQSGEIAWRKKLQRESNSHKHCITAMVVNWNDDICIAGYKRLWGGRVKGLSQLTVYTQECKFKFLYKKSNIQDISVDPWHNILVASNETIDVLKEDGSFMASFSTDVGIDGLAYTISIDSEGQYAWICTNTGKLVIIQYPALVLKN